MPKPALALAPSPPAPLVTPAPLSAARQRLAAHHREIEGAKARRNGEGFATLARWLGDNDAIFLRENRAAPLVCLPWRPWLRLLKRGST